MKKILPFFIVPTLFSCCGTPEKTTNAIQLNFDPAVGEKHQMIYEMQVNNSATGDSPFFKIAATIQVGSKNDGHITLITHYDNISMSGKIHGKEISLNAIDLVGTKDTTDAAVVASPVFAYLGKSFETVYDGRHNKLDEHHVRIAGDSSVVAAESKIQFIGRYPDEALEVGEGWDSEGPIRVGSNEISKMHYSVSAITDSEVKIHIEGKIDSDGEKFGQEYKVRGKLMGNIFVNRKNGWQKKADLDLDFTLEMGDKKIPMKQHIGFTVE
jgi:hypothetical protein